MSDLKTKLAEANAKAESAKAERRARTVKGSHLTDTFVKLAEEAGCDLRTNTGFHVIVGQAGKSYRIYVAKRGGIVDLLGFSVEDPAVRQISKEEAKAKHMGRVQGRLNLENTDEAILAAYRKALEVVNTPAPVVEKPAKAPRASRAPKTPTPEAIAAAAAPAAPANTNTNVQ